MPKNKAKRAVVRIKAQNQDLENRVNRALEEKGYNFPSDEIDEEPIFLDLTQLNGHQYRLILKELKKLPEKMTIRQMNKELQNVQLVSHMIHRTRPEGYPNLFPYARKLRVFSDELIVLRQYIERGKDIEMLMNSDLITSLYPRKEDIEAIIKRYPLTAYLGDKERGDLFSNLMKRLYDIHFIERLDWQDYVREEMAEKRMTKKEEKRLKKLGEQRAFYMLSITSYLTRDVETLDIIPREEVKISSPSMHPTYKVSFIIPDERKITIFMKRFEKDKDNEAFLREDGASWLYSQLLPKKEEHLVALSDNQFNYIIRGFISGEDTLNRLENLEELKRENKINEYMYNKRKYALIKERIRVTAKLHSLPAYYLAQPSLTPFEMVEKIRERFVSPLKEQKILTKKDHALEKNIVLGHLPIVNYTSKRPTIINCDGIWANLVNGIPFDHERVKEVTHKNDLDSALRFGYFLSDESNLNIKDALNCIKVYFDDFETYRTSKGGKSELQELGFNPGRIRTSTKISEQELFHRFYFREYNRTVGKTKKYIQSKTSNIIEYVKELFESSLIIGEDQKKVILDLIDPSANEPLIQSIFPRISQTVLNQDSPEVIKQAHWIQRYVSYLHFLNFPEEEKNKELKPIIKNELEYLNQRDQRVRFIRDALDLFQDAKDVLDIISKLKSSEEISEETKETISRENNTIYFSFSEMDRYLNMLSKARMSEKLESYKEFDKDPSGVQRTFDLYGARVRFMNEAEDNPTKRKELKYMQSLFINGITCLEQFNRMLTKKEKDQTLSQIIKELRLTMPELETLGISKRDYNVKVNNLIESYIASLSALKPKLIKYVQNIESRIQT